MLRQARAPPGARHGVPMIAHAPRIEDEGKNRVGRPWRWRANWHNARLAVACVEAAGPEEAGLGRRARPWPRPLKGLHPVITPPVDAGECADIEGTRPVILEGRECGVLGEDLGR